MPGTDDERVALALAALAEVTDPADVGPLEAVDRPEPGVVDLRFACALPGYPDWRWTVSTALLDDGAPTVLELGLLPGEGALLAPPWVPWTERLAEWRRTHADEAADEEDLDDEDDLDEADDLDEVDEQDALDDALDPDDEVDEEPGDDVDEEDPEDAARR